jgi:hypothetical protein
MPKTPLYERLAREGRVREIDDESDNTRARSNVIHKTMSDDVIATAYADVYRRLLTDDGIATRIRNKLRYFGKTGYRGGYTMNETVGLVGRLLTRGILPGGPARLWHFLRTFPIRRPSLAPTMIADWIAGLSMRAFARDNVWAALLPETGRLEAARARIARYVAQSEVWVSRQKAGLPSLNVHIGNELTLRFARKAVPEMKRLMKRTHTRLVLAIDNVPDDFVPDVEKLLKRLTKYSDRVFVELSETTRARLSIDLSAFHLVLVPAITR